MKVKFFQGILLMIFTMPCGCKVENVYHHDFSMDKASSAYLKVTAIIRGIIAKEWIKASSKARGFLYMGLACMIIGIVIIAIGKG